MKISRDKLNILIIAVAACAVYLPSITGGFAWDTLGQMLGTSLFSPHSELDYNKPLLRMLFKFEHASWGDNAIAYHLVSLLLHVVNAALVYVLAGKLFKNNTAALAAGLLFAIYPANIEAVAWPWAAGELIKALFALSSMLLYIAYREEGNSLALLSSALFCLLACLGGQGALVLPVIIILYEAAIGQDTTAGQEDVSRFKKPALFYLGAIVIYVVLFGGIGEFMPAKGHTGYSVYYAISAMGYYAMKLLLPYGLGVLPVPGDNPLYLVLALVVAGTPFFLWNEGKRDWGWLASLMPLLLLPAVLVVLWGVKTPYGFRFLYLPSMALALAIGFILSRVRARKVAYGFVIIILALSAVLSINNSLLWRHREALWAHAASRSSAPPLASINHAASLIAEERKDEAREPVKSALRDSAVTSDEFDRALALLEGIQTQEGELLPILTETKGEAQAFLGMGYIYYKRFIKGGKSDYSLLYKSSGFLANSVQADAKVPKARHYLGLSYLMAGNIAAAKDQFLILNGMSPAGKYSRDAGHYLSLINAISTHGPAKDATAR